jgi:hypothetical protein
MDAAPFCLLLRKNHYVVHTISIMESQTSYIYIIYLRIRNVYHTEICIMMNLKALFRYSISIDINFYILGLTLYELRALYTWSNFI